MWQLGESGAGPDWQVVETPFEISLFGVTQTVEGPYAVGNRGHLVGDRGDGWEVIFDDGPATRKNQLRAMDVTDDGERIWMLGSSGAMACYDVVERKKFDYSYPNEMTSTWEGITVSGERGNEKALAANGSGEVLPFTIDGFDVDWGQLAKPAGKGSKMAALASTPDGVGFAIDTSGNAFKTTAEEGWVDIGVVNAQVKFYDIYAGANQRVYIAAGDGRIYRYDDSYHNWTPIGVTDGTSLQSFDVRETENGNKQMVVLGADGSIYQRTGKERWQEVPSPTKQPLTALELGNPDVAVGENGTVIERPRGQPRDPGTSEDGDEFDGRGENFDGDETGANDNPENSKVDDDESTDDAGEETEAETETETKSSAHAERQGTASEDGTEAESADSGRDTDDESDTDNGTDSEDRGDSEDADDSDDGISRWSSTSHSSDNDSETTADTESADSSEDTDDTPDANDRADTDDSTNSDGSTEAEARADADATADTETKENVLVAIAERTDLDAVDVTEAAEHGSEIVESVLAQIAEDVGIDPERVRDALNRSPDTTEPTETAESTA